MGAKLLWKRGPVLLPWVSLVNTTQAQGPRHYLPVGQLFEGLRKGETPCKQVRGQEESLRGSFLKHYQDGTSLVVQWLRICLVIQRMWLHSLLGELRCHMPLRAHVLQLLSP